MNASTSEGSVAIGAVNAVIASTCLLVAAKFSDLKLPPISQLEKLHNANVATDEYKASLKMLELDILRELRWKLHVPLPHAFVEHFRTLCPDADFSNLIYDRVLFFIDLSARGTGERFRILR